MKELPLTSVGSVSGPCLDLELVLSLNASSSKLSLCAAKSVQQS